MNLLKFFDRSQLVRFEPAWVQKNKTGHGASISGSTCKSQKQSNLLNHQGF